MSLASEYDDRPGKNWGKHSLLEPTKKKKKKKKIEDKNFNGV